MLFWKRYDAQYQQEATQRVAEYTALVGSNGGHFADLGSSAALVAFERRYGDGFIEAAARNRELRDAIASAVQRVVDQARPCEPLSPPLDVTDPKERQAILHALDGAIACVARPFAFAAFFGHLLADLLPTLHDGDGLRVSVPLCEAAGDEAALVSRVLRELNGAITSSPAYAWFFRTIAPVLEENLSRLPRGKLPSQGAVRAVFGGTALEGLFSIPVSVAIPQEARFEHTHIVGGTGHGKTQLIQHMLLADLPKVARGEASVVVIDSQGDLIRAILAMRDFSPNEGSLASRLILIDPHDVEYPPCLNLFDVGQWRADAYSPVEREKLFNNAVTLYDYLFGALLGSELTQRQGLVFRYLARLMLTVEGATIHTLREFCENPRLVQPFLPQLDPLTREFFETVFLSRSFDGTRKQILTRLWGVCSNTILERMLGNPTNKVDMFHALNSGSVVLINTAKDLLKQEGCELLGRFFIALIAHAAQERSLLPKEQRLPTFVYIDEAHDYLDENVDYLLNQARKYRVGLVLAHQNLEQLSKRLHASMMSSTSVKMVGGLSYADARAFAREMRTTEEELLRARKHADHTEFAVWVRNHFPRPVLMRVPFGQMEARGALTPAQHEALLALSRARIAQRREPYRYEPRAPEVPFEEVAKAEREGRELPPTFEPL